MGALRDFNCARPMCNVNWTSEFRREAGIVSSRIEEDKVEILSGTFEGRTTGAPIAMIVRNRDVDSRPYEPVKDVPRPGHADYPARIRYGGFNDYRGGGQFSGRMTAALVMAGAVAKKLLARVRC